MTYEFKKLFFSRPIIILFICLIAANAAAFYGKCTAKINRYTLSDVRQKYEKVNILEKEVSFLEEMADRNDYRRHLFRTGSGPVYTGTG